MFSMLTVHYSARKKKQMKFMKDLASNANKTLLGD